MEVLLLFDSNSDPKPALRSSGDDALATAEALPGLPDGSFL